MQLQVISILAKAFVIPNLINNKIDVLDHIEYEKLLLVMVKNNKPISKSKCFN